MRLSVILPTSGRSASLAETLPTVLSQTLRPGDFEVLVVENGPTISSRHVVARALSDRPGVALRYVHEPTPGLLSGRHRGALEALGEILVFADDDIDASSAWLAAIDETFSDPAVQLVGGPSLPRFERTPPDWVDGYWYTPPYGGRACTNLSLLNLGEVPLEIDANYVWGLNFAIRRETLFELQGFHPDNLPAHLQQFQGDGETGLTMKANAAGLRAIYQPGALVHHRVPAARLTLEYFLHRARYQGVCDSFTAIRRDPSCLTRSELTTEGEDGDKSSAAVEEATFELVEQNVQAAYRRGYAFHQSAVRRQPRLLDWVMRRDYWDYRLPDLGPSTLIRSDNQL